jgi:hypothetical protein
MHIRVVSLKSDPHLHRTLPRAVSADALKSRATTVARLVVRFPSS